MSAVRALMLSYLFSIFFVIGGALLPDRGAGLVCIGIGVLLWAISNMTLAIMERN